MSLINKKIQNAIDVVFDYLSIKENPEKSDAIFVAGGATINPAIKAFELYKLGYSKKIISTAKKGTFSNPDWIEDEAIVYKNKLIELGVPSKSIIIDPISRNSLDEADDSIYLLRQNNIILRKIIIVDRPIHQRREYATFAGLHDNLKIKFINCPADESVEYTQDFINRIVAEMDRLNIYALQGTLRKQYIPLSVKKAYQLLQNNISMTFGDKQ